MAKKMPLKEIMAAYMELQKIKKEIKDLEVRKNVLQFALIDTIPMEKNKGGVYHSIKGHTSVAWAKAADAIIKTLVPKTPVKQKKAAAIIEEFTSRKTISIFKEVGK